MRGGPARDGVSLGRFLRALARERGGPELRNWNDISPGGPGVSPLASITFDPRRECCGQIPPLLWPSA